MSTIPAPGKKIKDICNQLGSDYSIQVIDLENCIYRKLNDKFDIEISGLDNRRKSFNCNVYLWSLKPGKSIEATYSDISSFEQLLELLQSLEMLYS